MKFNRGNYINISLKIKIYNLVYLFIKSYKDSIFYLQHSSLLKVDTFEKIESLIIIKYHSLEKGFTNNKIKYKFGRQVVIDLLSLIKKVELSENYNRSQISAAVNVLCKYYDFHNKNSIDISNFYCFDDYKFLKKFLSASNLITEFNKNYFSNSNERFDVFSKSRKSVRSFKSEIIKLSRVKMAIDLASNAPSVCNRQSTSVYYTENIIKINSVFAIQQGLRGFDEGVKQLLVVTTNINYFHFITEKNQPYIDGGIFLMNLLYSLHFYEIAACPAHWCLDIACDKKIRNLLNIKDSEKIISLIAIGNPNDIFETTPSIRRSVSEIFKIAN